MTSFDFSIGNGNPRNSEGSFLVLDKDRIAFAYTSFRGETARDYTSADIKMTYSQDGGVSWSEPVTIVEASAYNAMNVMSVSLLQMMNGDMGLFYLVRMSWLDMYIVMQRSSDQGKTWSAPTRCSTRPGYFVINNDRVTRLSSNRIVIPAAEHKNKIDQDGKVIFAPASTSFFLSDDDGKTWVESQSVLSLDYPICHSGLQEPGVVEINEGHLYGWARTDLSRQYEFHSYDNGLHWSSPVPSRFTSPLSPLSMKRLRNGEFFAVWNPVPLDNMTTENKATGNRTPLVYALSPDGLTWEAPITIEDDPHSGYCYTAILELEDAVLLGYCAGSKADLGSCLNRLRIRRISLPSTASTKEEGPHSMGIGIA